MSEDDPYKPLSAVMALYGATCTPREFYWAVNDAFHAWEAHCYDARHESMYQEEQMVWRRLLDLAPAQPAELRVLDVGCGTGLVGHFINEMMPHRVAKITLLDPSQAMLEVVRKKAETWQFGFELVHGDIAAAQGAGMYDLITINSVLHHIVDLQGFGEAIGRLLRPGGRMLSAQDPNPAARSDPVTRDRMAAAKRSRRSIIWPADAIFRRLRRWVTPAKPTEMEINTSAPLLKKGLIQRTMDERSIYAVTDFHVPGLTAGLGKGISPERLSPIFTGMKLVTSFTYDFQGIPWTDLTPEQRDNERRWFDASEPHGLEIAMAWEKSAASGTAGGHV